MHNANQKFPVNAEDINWEVLAAKLSQRQPEAIAELKQMYQQLFNQSIKKGCGSCYNKAFFRIRKAIHLKQNTGTPVTTGSQYALKPGSCLQMQFGGQPVTNHNLTDELAEQLLKAYPAMLQHFERYPNQIDQ